MHAPSEVPGATPRSQRRLSEVAFDLGGSALLIARIVGPMAFFYLFGASVGRMVDVGSHSVTLPVAAIGCALCADFAERCYHEDPAKTGRPRVAAVACGVGWTLMSWVCAFAFGRAM